MTSAFLIVVSGISTVKIVTLRLFDHVVAMPYISFAVTLWRMMIDFLYATFSGNKWHAIESMISRVLMPLTEELKTATPMSNVDGSDFSIISGVAGCMLAAFVIFACGTSMLSMFLLAIWSINLSASATAYDKQIVFDLFAVIFQSKFFQFLFGFINGLRSFHFSWQLFGQQLSHRAGVSFGCRDSFKATKRLVATTAVFIEFTLTVIQTYPTKVISKVTWTRRWDQMLRRNRFVRCVAVMRHSTQASHPMHHRCIHSLRRPRQCTRSRLKHPRCTRSYRRIRWKIKGTLRWFHFTRQHRLYSVPIHVTASAALVTSTWRDAVLLTATKVSIWRREHLSHLHRKWYSPIQCIHLITLLTFDACLDCRWTTFRTISKVESLTWASAA